MSDGPTEADDGEASALAAAQAVAREHGVACDDAVRIAAGSNVLVHLKPAPVVARVMTGTAVLHDDAEQWLAREVAVGAFLAERTDLVVPPTDILPPGPYEQDGLWMTLWRFVATRRAGSAAGATGTRPFAAGTACGARRLPG